MYITLQVASESDEHSNRSFSLTMSELLHHRNYLQKFSPLQPRHSTYSDCSSLVGPSSSSSAGTVQHKYINFICDNQVNEYKMSLKLKRLFLNDLLPRDYICIPQSMVLNLLIMPNCWML